MKAFPSPFTALLSKLTITDDTIVTIQCNGGDVRAKKILLTTVSDVFRCMFQHDFLEKKTNTVMADDVHFPTMEFIIQCYTRGTVALVDNQVDKEDFEYIVEKYNFIGIRDEVAEMMIHIYRKTGNIEALANVFFLCDSQKWRMTALKEIVPIITAGKKAPDFIDVFTIEEFKEFSRICCHIMKDSKVDQWQSFLEAFYSWTKYPENPEERSMTSLEILGMMNIEQFPVTGVLTLLENLKLGDTIQIIKSISEKLLRYILKMEVKNPPKIQKSNLPPKSSSTNINCIKCGHNDKLPYHYSSKCTGRHLKCMSTECPHNLKVLNDNPREKCYVRLIYPNIESRVFGSVTR
ncbi:uncharacterized protein LOC136041391 [Artemia franciscana]|uniref:uncharacterized protein LOC136041391 n=1 Tax=Artemia franciscana TaxID=6661 RepID=UPI0032DB3FAB